MARNVYVALGDAITAGQGASQQNLGFVHHVSEFARTKTLAERTIVIAEPGLTAKRLFQIATTLQSKLWDDASVVTVCLGTADFSRLLRPRRLSLNGKPFSPRAILNRADEFGYHIDQLLRLIHEKNVPYVLVTTLYNPFPSFTPAREFTAGLNSIILDCASYYNFPVIDLEKGFENNEAYLIEGFRTGGALDLMTPLRKPMLPNNAGHKLISYLIAQRLNRLIAKSKPPTPRARLQPTARIRSSAKSGRKIQRR